MLKSCLSGSHKRCVYNKVKLNSILCNYCKTVNNRYVTNANNNNISNTIMYCLFRGICQNIILPSRGLPCASSANGIPYRLYYVYTSSESRENTGRLYNAYAPKRKIRFSIIRDSHRLSMYRPAKLPILCIICVRVVVRMFRNRKQ